MSGPSRRGARFKELADVCQANDLHLGLAASLVSGKPNADSARYVLVVVVSDGADGATKTAAAGSTDLDGAAELTLAKLRRARVVP